jgi:shikimate kinase
MEDREQPTGDVLGKPPSSILHPKSSIFLVGYRCTGKTTAARLLAARLGRWWADNDDLVEAKLGRSVREIFAERGEAGFRDCEAAALRELCGHAGGVVATGGGAVLREENRRRMRAAGTVVWLTAGAETLWRRMQADPATAERRPALTVGGLAEVRELLAAREPLYREAAHLIIDTDSRSPEAVVDAILREPTPDD